MIDGKWALKFALFALGFNLRAEVAEPSEWLPVWMEASRRVKTAMGHLQEFTCLQDTHRTTASPKKALVTDTLQVEVGVINGREAQIRRANWRLSECSPRGICMATSTALWEIATGG